MLKNNKIIKFILLLNHNFHFHDIPGVSAQLAYYFIFSIFPLLLLLLSLLPLFNISPDIVSQQITNYIPTIFADEINNIITSLLSASNAYVITISILLSLWSGSSITNVLLKVINKINRGKITRNFLKRRLISILFTFVFIMIIILTIISIPLGNDFIRTYLSFEVESIFTILTNLIIPFILSALLFCIYYFGTGIKIKKFYALPGTIFSVISFFVLNSLFNFYIINFSTYDLRYGAVSIIIVFMLWSYLIGMLIMIGALINATLIEFNTKKNTPY